MKDIKITMESDVSQKDTIFSYTGDVTLEMAGKILEYIAGIEAVEFERKDCPFPDCPRVKYKNCPTHGLQTLTDNK